MIDPWGTVLAECPEGVGVITAEIDLQYLEKVRTQMPVQQHRRHDLYGNLSLQCKGTVMLNFCVKNCNLSLQCKSIAYILFSVNVL